MKAASFLLLLLAGAPAVALAQTSSMADSPRLRGELTGARPASRVLARPRAHPTPGQGGATDPVQQHLLNSEVNLARVQAYELPDLYERFITTTRDERRQWRDQDWEGAGAVLARLNQRYEAVRTELPLDERLRIRSFQGEFHTLRGARQAKDRLR